MADSVKRWVKDIRILEAARQFQQNDRACRIEPLGKGNINDTYLVHGKEDSFVLQRINDQVFPQPERVVLNFFRISEYIKAKLGAASDQWECISCLPTRNGKPFYRDSHEGVWRAQTYLDETVTYTVIETSHRARQVGWALGHFHSLLSDLPHTALYDTLPGFHNLPRYMQRFEKAEYNHCRPTSAELSYCFDYLEKCPLQIDALEKARSLKIFTTRVIHGDPKVDNFLFRRLEDRVVGLIDLDTVGPGLLHYDLGDCLRSCCNTSGEQERNMGEVSFDVGLCRELLKGYYAAAEDILQKNDKKYVFEAVSLITFELGVRFLTDYLEGNSYFKVEYEEENLHRALLQFRLVENILEQEQIIRRVAEGK